MATEASSVTMSDAEWLMTCSRQINMLVRSYAGQGVDPDDLQQEAAIEALKAIRAWEAEAGSTVQSLVRNRVEYRLGQVTLSARRRRRVETNRLDEDLGGGDKEEERTLHDCVGEAAGQESVTDAAKKWVGLTDVQRTELVALDSRAPSKGRPKGTGQGFTRGSVRDVATRYGIGKTAATNMIKKAKAEGRALP